MNVDYLTLVADDRVVRVSFGSTSSIERIDFSVVVDDGPAWAFSQPGWRPLSAGVSNGRIYLWSAREIIVLPDDTRTRPGRISVDEDLLCVYSLDELWLLVCESSVRLLVAEIEVSSVHFGEVVESAWLTDDQLTVRQVDGRASVIRIIGENLEGLN